MLGKIVFCIDDEPDTIDLVRLILKRGGYEVIGATGGREALARLPEVAPDLILLDVMMPDMDGWTVLQAMREDEMVRHIPVVLFTATRPRRPMARIDGYIAKPFTPHQLLDGVRQILDN
jgi:CheY-like chemotaxis protein